MIDRWTARLRLLRRQERAHLFPVRVGEGWNSQQAQGSRWVCRHSRSLAYTTQHLEALRSCLVLTSKVRPVQSPGLLLLRLTHRVQEATYLWHAQCDPLVDSTTFFSCARACPRITTRAA